MEQGKQTVIGGVRIQNVGAPTVPMILSAGCDMTTPRDMLEAIDRVLPQRQPFQAFGSRFGLIIFSGNLQTEPLTRHRTLLKKNGLVVSALFEEVVPKVRNLPPPKYPGMAEPDNTSLS